jgi:hypothetical protein
LVLLANARDVAARGSFLILHLSCPLSKSPTAVVLLLRG